MERYACMGPRDTMEGFTPCYGCDINKSCHKGLDYIPNEGCDTTQDPPADWCERYPEEEYPEE